MTKRLKLFSKEEPKRMKLFSSPQPVRHKLFSSDDNVEILEKAFVLPIFSRSARISGWKIIIHASNPQLIKISVKYVKVDKPKNLAKPFTATMATMPLNI